MPTILLNPENENTTLDQKRSSSWSVLLAGIALLALVVFLSSAIKSGPDASMMQFNSVFVGP
jgi:bacteriorhodopsin